MTPLGRYSLYCDHGIHVGHECVRCWQRRALDAEATIATLTAMLETSVTLDVWRMTVWEFEKTIAELREELAQFQNAAGAK